MKTRVPILVSLLLFVCCTAVFAQSNEGQEPVAVLEIGGVPNRSLTEGQWSLGPTLAVEVTPIKNWLEIEVGSTISFSHHTSEWSADFLLKKPWDLSRTVEFMVGIGPECLRTKQFGVSTNSFAVEAVLDFMFWTNANHRIGWYLEPSYDFSFKAGHERSAGAAVGLLIGIY